MLHKILPKLLASHEKCPHDYVKEVKSYDDMSY